MIDCNISFAVQNACASSPCLNGASCITDVSNTYSCLCANGFSGLWCNGSYNSFRDNLQLSNILQAKP